MRKADVSLFLRLCLGSAALMACGPPDNGPQPIPEGIWRVEFVVPGGMLPVSLELSRTADGLTAAFINGPERVSVPRAIEQGHRLELEFPAFNNRLVGEWNGRTLDGTLTLIKRGGVVQEIPFRARPGVEYRFVPRQSGAQADVSGRWAVTFVDDDGVETPAIGEFTQQGNGVLGTFLTETGDYRYLAGELIGEQLLISTFDGAHLFLFAARLDAGGELRGDFWSGNAWHETWTARRDPDANLADAFAMTFLKPGYERLAFTFPDLEGKPVSLSDSRFAGKVVLVTLAGTWCPNCHDEARFLAPFYEAYREQGLEVVALLYEHFDDFGQAAAQARKFRDELGIEYPLLIAGYSDKQAAAETLPMLNRVLAFPTTIFIDRNGEVRRIHTGFTGPGTGQHFEKFTAEFEDYVRSLLAGPG